MATAVIPDRLIELAELWRSPYRWEAMAHERADLQRNRGSIHETQIARHQFKANGCDPALLALTEFIIEHDRSFEKDAERRYDAFVTELVELETLVIEYAPDLFGNLPNLRGNLADGVPDSERARGIQTLIGLLLARRQAAPPPRVRCVPETRSVFLDGKEIGTIADSDAFAFFKAVIDAAPDAIPFKETPPGKKGKNQTRVKEELPPVLRRLLKTSSAGWRYNPPLPK